MSLSREEIYKRSVVGSFSFLKSSETIQDAYLRAISVGDRGFLVPIGRVHLDDPSILKLLTDWRNTHVNAYPTRFVATVESTKKWMRAHLLDIEGRILFLLVDKAGRPLGHIGLNGCMNERFEMELDNIVRGASEGPGIFSEGLMALIQWARTTINVDSFFLRVLEDNAHAISFYKKNGFIELSKIPLVRDLSTPGLEVLRESDARVAEIHFIKMGLEVNPSAYAQNEMILTAGPSISAREAVYAYDAAKLGWNRNWSYYLTRFETQFSEYVGAKYALATSSCTGALQIALLALGIGPGDEVIVPDQTWVATANAVRYVGATPVFSDVELDSWCIDADSIERSITPKTKAIICVHMYGHPARMNRIKGVAEKYNLRTIEDAAPAIGAEWMGQRCGSFGDFAAFSFQGAKLLVTGEGGMLVTNNRDLYEIAKKVWDQGRNPSRDFWIDDHGVKFKMSNIQAAIGLGQLERVDELVDMKRRLFSWYERELSGVNGIVLNKEVEGARSIYWMSSIRLLEDNPISRDALREQLKLKNIDTRPVFPAISQYPIWETTIAPRVNADLIGRQSINLPSGVCLRRSEVLYICDQIRTILTG